VGAVGAAAALEDAVAGEGLDAKPADVVLLDGGPEAALVGDDLGLGGVGGEDAVATTN